MADKLIFELYGGVGVIGGNKIRMRTKKGKQAERNVWLDMGLDFKLNGKYNSEFVKARGANGMTDFFKLGLVPEIEKLYRPDLLAQSRNVDVADINAQGVDCDGVMISHGHFDHMAFVSHLHPSIPIISSRPTYAVMQTLQDAGAGSDKDFIQYKAKYYEKLKDREVIDRDFRFIEDDPITLGNLVVRGIPVDHSLPGATAYIIETPKGTVVYTGDLRFHGWNSKLSEEFVKQAAAAKPLVLLTEGTNINEEPGMSEPEVYQHISDAIRKTKSLVVANFPARDVDRLNSFLKAAKDNGRKLAIDFKQAYLLKCMQEAGCSHVSPAINPNAKQGSLEDLFSDDIVVFARQKKDGRILRGFSIDKVVSDYFAWEREFLASNSGTAKKPVYGLHDYIRNAHDIRDEQDKYVVYIDNFAVQNLIDLEPAEGSTYVYSKTEPFDAEMEQDFEKLENWVRDYIGIENMTNAHASGHAFGSQLVDMIREINPQILIPIHTEHPEMFEELLKAGADPYKGNIIVPQLSSTRTGNIYPIDI
ncbi:MAG: MBL fold metallo-hydrolase [Candidatus Woesearchaeota archaeon]